MENEHNIMASQVMKEPTANFSGKPENAETFEMCIESDEDLLEVAFEVNYLTVG